MPGALLDSTDFQWQMMQNNIPFGAASANVAVGVASPPTLSAITPSAGNVGQHDFQIVITGSNLTGATLSVPSSSHVAFATSPAPTVTASQITALVAIANDAPVQTIPLTVTTPGGSQSVNFSVTAANPQGQPVVTSLSPTSLLTGATQTFTLTGSNLTHATVTTDSSLTINSIANVSDTQLQVTVAANGTPTGTYFFTVSVPQYGLSNVSFRVLDATGKPTIDSVAPANPSAGGVYYFHLTGNNLAGAEIHADNAGIHILRGAAQLQGVSQAPAGYEMVVGLLTVDPNVAPGTAHLIASNAAGQTAVEIQIGSLTSASGIQVQAGKLTSALTTFDKQVRNNGSIILGGFGACSGACAPTEIDVVSFQVGIPFIQCGNSWFDTSCLNNMKIGHPLNLTVGFIGVRVRIYVSLGFQLYCDDYECFCVPEPCALSANLTIDFVVPTGQSLQFTPALPSFLLAGTPDCSQSGVCADTINVVDLPQDTQICAGLVNMTFLGGFGFAPASTCVNATAGLNAKLSANPNIIDQGSPTTLSWQLSTSVVQVIHIDHVHIQNTLLDLPYDCGDQLGDFACPPGQAVSLTPSGTTDYSGTFTGTVGGVQDFFPASSSAAQQAAASASVTVLPAQTSGSPKIFPVATGGVAPNANVITVTLTNQPAGTTLNFGTSLSSNPGGSVNAQLQVAVDNSALTGTFTAIPVNPSESSASGIFAVSICSQIICDRQQGKITVPPQSLIQVISGEAFQQGSNAKFGLAAVTRNRLNASGFTNNTSYNGLIFAGCQYNSTCDSTSKFFDTSSRAIAPDLNDYDTNVVIASEIFDGTQPDTTGGSLFFLSPTANQMQGVNDALQSGTTIFPASLGIFLQGSGGSSAWQVVVLSSMETNTNRADSARFGQPAFIFSRRRASTDPAVVNLP